MAQPRLNLKNVVALLVDSDRFTRRLVVQMMRGFRMDTPAIRDTGADAKQFLQQQTVDLIVTEAVLPDMPSSELIRWVRRPEMGSVRFIPVIVLSGYTQLPTVAAARDAGANSVLKKPVSPQALFDRILWVARVPRPFIDSGTYTGPDRRFKADDPPDQTYKRSDDTPAECAPAEQSSNRLAAAVAKGTSR
ncbi:MAG: response regulator [Rhizomicrobium sp.]|jgi:CheY-like chemotaxis protein